MSTLSISRLHPEALLTQEGQGLMQVGQGGLLSMWFW